MAVSLNIKSEQNALLLNVVTFNKLVGGTEQILRVSRSSGDAEFLQPQSLGYAEFLQP